ncbi:MAG: PAS domain S-box protein, partial [Flavobacterium sp.]
MEELLETGITEGNGKSPLFNFNQELFEGLPVAVYVCDTNGKIIFYNEAAAELWGRKPDPENDLWCGSWKIYKLNGEAMDFADCPMATAIHERRAVTGEEIIVEKPDGTLIHVLPHPKPVFDPTGIVVGAVNMLVEVSSKKSDASYSDDELKYRPLSELLERKVEERTFTLRESEERYHKMVEEVQDYAIVLLDRDGYILNWNRGAENIKGYSEKDILGKNFRVFYRDSDRFDQLPEKLIQEASDNGRAMHEGWRLRKDGSAFWGSIVITALHDDRDNIIGFSKVTRDLTERKLAEDQIKEYAKDIEFRNKQLEEYAYIASHDLQEPLRKIQVFSEMLERKIDDKEAVKRNLDKINTSARRMSTLIKDVLKYSQLSQTDALFTSVDLNAIVDAVKEDFELLIAERQVAIYHASLPTLQGVPIQLHQLFSNLISNSIKFCTQAPVISITSEEASKYDLCQNPELDPNQLYYKLTFKDNGTGFEQQYGEQVFKMFKRLG